MPRSIDSRPSRHASGFTIFELLVVIVCVAAILATQIPTQAAARRTARRMQNSTQLRGIHQALVTFANSNKNKFAGMTSNGEILADGDKTTGSSGRGDYVQARYWILLDGDYFTPEYGISPSETENIVTYDRGRDKIAAPVQWNRAVKHYSYAMLDIHADPNNPKVVAKDAAGRGQEWAQTLNSQAIVLSDRNIGTDTGRNVQSIHSRRSEWTGSVLWNDNHVAFESSMFLETKFANGGLHDGDPGDGADGLFTSEKDANGLVGYDALMVTADHNIVHSGLIDADAEE